MSGQARGAAAGVAPRLLALLLAAGGGVAWAFQFGAEGHLVASWVAFAPLVLLLDGRRPGAYAWLHGVVTWLVAIPWIAPTLQTFGHLPRPVSWLLLVVLALYLGGFHGLFGLLGGRLWRHGRAVLLLFALPSLWIALEWSRGWLFSGFPWNLAAYAWVEVPGALPLASWIGPWGVGWLVVFANCGVALAAVLRRPRWAALGVLAPLLLLGLAGRFAGTAESQAAVAQPFRLLQPNLPILQDPYDARVGEGYGRVLAQSRAACDVPGALVVWPESAGWPYSYDRHAAFRADLEALLTAGCPLLLNSAAEADDGLRNAAYLLGPGTMARADKRHLVPFGEYVPLAGLLPFMDALARQAGSFVPGQEVRLLDWGRERLGLSICFEITFPSEVAETVRHGATVLVTITNDAWYGDSWAPWQHFRAARFRAAEVRRPLLRSALTGISAVVAPDGSLEALLGPYEEGTLRGTVAGRGGLTPYARFPWAVPAASVITAFAALVTARRRRAAAPGLGNAPAEPAVPVTSKQKEPSR